MLFGKTTSSYITLWFILFFVYTRIRATVTDPVKGSPLAASRQDICRPSGLTGALLTGGRGRARRRTTSGSRCGAEGVSRRAEDMPATPSAWETGRLEVLFGRPLPLGFRLAPGRPRVGFGQSE